MTDNEMFLRVSEGDPEAFRELVKAYFPMLCRYAGNYLSDASLAKDAVQEAFIKFWQYNNKDTEDIIYLKALLFTITRNTCLNMLRGREREEKRNQNTYLFHSQEDHNIYDEIVRLEYYAQINQIVQRMPEKMREVFLLSFEEDLPIAEIADQLKISVKTVRNQKYKALVLLRNALGNSGIPLLFILAKY